LEILLYKLSKGFDGAVCSGFKISMDLLEITAHISYGGGITEYEVLLDNEFRVNGKVYRTDIVQSDIDPSRGTYNPTDNKFRANDGPHWPVFGPDVTIAPPYTVRCTTQGFSYSIRYVDEAGNELIPSSYGVAYTNEWKDLNMEFSVTLYDPGTEYIVKQQQAYPPANYVYNSASNAKVLVGRDTGTGSIYDDFRIICERFHSLLEGL
jgi:hypothetical protein